MTDSAESDRRENNFGFLRLLFAALVILSHSPVLVAGNIGRDLLMRLFGTITFGALAVDGFFIISGYLVTMSFVKRHSVPVYFLKRFLRIFPGYLACFIICAFCVAPFVGATNSFPAMHELRALFWQARHLLPPDVPDVFVGLNWPYLNGSMWTIAYEFRCYVATAVLGVLGLYNPRLRLIAIIGVVICIALNATDLPGWLHTPEGSYVGDVVKNIRFAAAFGIGSLFYLFDRKIPLNHKGAMISGALLFVLLFYHSVAEAALFIFGGYLIFWFAFKVPVLALSRFNNRVDISYGVYLYAWPIQNTLLWYQRDINPWLHCLISLIGAVLLGYLSWILIEKPFLNLAPRQLSLSLFPRNRAGTGISATTEKPVG
jgi:peptidoglycan/LPS O-acetylase OafA/YrhL